jgi:hypothetical protein
MWVKPPEFALTTYPINHGTYDLPTGSPTGSSHEWTSSVAWVMAREWKVLGKYFRLEEIPIRS